MQFTYFRNIFRTIRFRPPFRFYCYIIRTYIRTSKAKYIYVQRSTKDEADWPQHAVCFIQWSSQPVTHFPSHAWDVMEWFSRLLDVRVGVMCILVESLCFFFWQGNIPCAGLSQTAAHDICHWQQNFSSRFRLQLLYTARSNSAGLNRQINSRIQSVPRSKHTPTQL
jgi:hypothetical protein